VGWGSQRINVAFSNGFLHQKVTNILHYILAIHAQAAEDGTISTMFRRVSSSREMPVMEKVSENSNGRGMDKRAIGALVVELSLTVVGYFILYQSAKSLIGMIDPTKKDKDSVAQVGRRAGSGRDSKLALGTLPQCFYVVKVAIPFVNIP
jgi:hypothetical protein